MESRNKIIKRTSLCPVEGCDKKYSGDKKQTIKLMQLHQKVAHPNIIFDSFLTNRHFAENKGHFRTDKEIKEHINSFHVAN